MQGMCNDARVVVKTWFRNLVDRFRDAGSARPIARLTLVAFGKHPAWDDHIDDIGLDAEMPVTAKRLLYVRGIGENIDAGNWAPLEQDGTVVPFGHRFVWCQHGQLFAGRLWASQDGRGRRSYPMVVGAYLRASSSTWVYEQLLPMFNQIEKQFMRAESIDQVRRCLNQWQQELRKSEAACTMSVGESGRETSLARLARDAELGLGY